ncbi:MAG: glycerol kinase GlpK [Candidatus Hodarchaeales archaeon]
MVKEKYIGAIDQGTTGTKFMVFDHESNLISAYYKEHEQIFPKFGWVEHNPMEIWKNTELVINKALQSAKLSITDLKAIGITNQRETTVVWDKKSGIPVSNAIVWQCIRTNEICEALKKEGLENEIQSRTGLVTATYFSGPKIQWILDNIRESRVEANKNLLLFGNIDTWIIWNLTGGVNGGVHVTDHSNASRTMLMNLKTLKWDSELLDILKIPSSMLPEIRPSSDTNLYGFVKNGKGDGPPVSGDLGDQQAALFGQTCFETGNAKNTYGTGNFLLLNTGKDIVKSESGLISTVGYGIGKEITYALEGSIAISGAAVQWLRDQLGFFQTVKESEELASSVKTSGGVYFVPAFVGLFSPHWDVTARGTLVGLTRGSDKAHITRAVLESIAFQTLDVFKAMELDSKVHLSSLRVDGGASKNNLLMQFQADILACECVRPKIEETTALGAAYAAGLAVGYWQNLEELREKWAIDKVFSPKMGVEERNNLLHYWNKAVGKAKGWIDPI